MVEVAHVVANVQGLTAIAAALLVGLRKVLRYAKLGSAMSDFIKESITASSRGLGILR